MIDRTKKIKQSEKTDSGCRSSGSGGSGARGDIGRTVCNVS
jgi:hypothetical protein